MTPKQRKAHRRAAKAIAELCRETAEDSSAFNLTIELLAKSTGSAIGSACGVHELGEKILHEASLKAARLVQEEAAHTYGKYLAFVGESPSKHLIQ